ncbi:hypothetical protein ILYODFUR_034650 [Ilyodon furcidens]|uniref:Uncharacterized protein n=1 Tax=Ilyodon furcidens TaxID=33524 RepID=A0ABV0T433_9TELE
MINKARDLQGASSYSCDSQLELNKCLLKAAPQLSYSLTTSCLNQSLIGFTGAVYHHYKVKQPRSCSVCTFISCFSETGLLHIHHKKATIHTNACGQVAISKKAQEMFLFS